MNRQDITDNEIESLRSRISMLESKVAGIISILEATLDKDIGEDLDNYESLDDLYERSHHYVIKNTQI